MKKINIIKSNNDYERIIKTGKYIKGEGLVLYFEKKYNDTYRFGFSISKKIGSAVERNKVRRQIKNILDKKNYQNGFSCIIMVKKGFLEKSFIEKEKLIFEMVEKIQILKGEPNEKKQ